MKEVPVDPRWEWMARGWPDSKKGPWIIRTRIAPVHGRWELVGLAIEPNPHLEPVALTSTVLKQLHPPQLFARHRKLQDGAGQKAAEALRRQLAQPMRSEDERDQIYRSAVSALPRTGRPKHWTPAKLAEVARVYREAWTGLKRKPPTKAVAARFDLSASGAAKVVKLARAAGLLPPTTPGRPGWSEPAPAKIGRDSKEKRS